MSFIEELQKKPRKTRVLIAWTASICVMVIIVIIWIFSFARSLNTEKAKGNTDNADIPSLFKSIGKDFSLIREKLEASFKSIKDQLNEGETEQQ